MVAWEVELPGAGSRRRRSQSCRTAEAQRDRGPVAKRWGGRESGRRWEGGPAESYFAGEGLRPDPPANTALMDCVWVWVPLRRRRGFLVRMEGEGRGFQGL